ncbi:MAG: LLM class F420-dependent oxidoreductase [Tepidiformaceae bacterium]
MKLGLHVANFTWGLDPPEFAARLSEVACAAEDAGFARLSVMDHFFQLPQIGPAQAEMFEAYTTLGFLAARTRTIQLGVLVTGVTYRNPGILAKQVTTLDVLSGGRAWLGIGAAWFEREHLGLGVPFPPLRERFQRLEEAIQVCLQMWSDNDGAYEGRHYQLAETLNSPRPVSRPHPPILIGGSGEKKTLRLVARYSDICNVRAESPEALRQRFEVLRGHCEAEGRNYDDIERTIVTRFDVGPGGERADEVVDTLGRMAEAGAQGAMGYLIGCETLRPFEVMATKVMPQVARF